VELCGVLPRKYVLIDDEVMQMEDLEDPKQPPDGNFMNAGTSSGEAPINRTVNGY
jgi:hypothetical protein